MSTALGEYAPQILALLAGGLMASLGLVWAARSARGRAMLERVGPAAGTVAALAMVAGAGTGIWLMLRSLVGAAAARETAIGTGEAFLFGVFVGLPLSLPGLFLLWSDTRAVRKRRAGRRDAVPTKDDRRAYAEDLARQIRDVSPRPREVTASIGGEGGRVLALSGDIDAEEGERLTAALRRDLGELGFNRVEGSGGDRSWWARV